MTRGEAINSAAASASPAPIRYGVAPAEPTAERISGPSAKPTRERGDVRRHRAGAVRSSLSWLTQVSESVNSASEAAPSTKRSGNHSQIPGMAGKRQHEGGDDECAKRHAPRADPPHHARQDRRDRQHAERMHGGIEADQRSRGAALGEIEGDQRRAQGVGQAEDRRRGDHRGKRRQMTAAAGAAAGAVMPVASPCAVPAAQVPQGHLQPPSPGAPLRLDERAQRTRIVEHQAGRPGHRFGARPQQGGDPQVGIDQQAPEAPPGRAVPSVPSSAASSAAATVTEQLRLVRL